MGTREFWTKAENIRVGDYVIQSGRFSNSEALRVESILLTTWDVYNEAHLMDVNLEGLDRSVSMVGSDRVKVERT